MTSLCLNLMKSLSHVYVEQQHCVDLNIYQHAGSELIIMLTNLGERPLGNQAWGGVGERESIECVSHIFDVWFKDS